MIAAAVLTVIINYCTGGGCMVTKTYDIASLPQCYELVANAKIVTSDGGDAEGTVLMYCTPK